MKVTITSLLVLGLGIGIQASNMELDLSHEFNSILMPRTLTNLQTFTQALGGAVAPPITDSGNAQRPFEVGGDTFTDFQSAATRSCNNQHNSCADVANSQGSSAGFKVGDCDTQQTACLAAQQSATQTNFQVLTSSNADFDFICDS